MLVVQNREAREYTDDEVYALEVIAMVIAEMAELGAFVGPGPMEARPHKQPFFARGLVGQEGVAEGTVVLHEPQILVTEPISDDPERETARLRAAIEGAARRGRRDAGGRLPERRRRAPRRAERLPDVRLRQGLGAAHGGDDRDRPRRRGRRREGAVGHPRPHVARRRSLPARAAARSRRPVEPAAAAAHRRQPAHRPRAARRRDPGRAQHRPGRAARLWPQPARRGAGGGLGRQPRGDRRPGAGDPAGHPGRRASPARR